MLIKNFKIPNVVSKPAFLLIMAIALCGAAQTAGAEQELTPPKRNPHTPNELQSCQSCHAPQIPALLHDDVSTCTKCHAGNIGNHPVTKHPMGKAPNINIPSYLPLSGKGQIVCSTCHDPHGKSGNKRLLRVEYFKLCASCHVGY